MALTDAEVTRIKYELGLNVLTVGAEPYISYVSLFDLIIKPFTESGASTTSSSVVTAASTPTFTWITLASVTGFTAGARVIVDVDSRQEAATIRDINTTQIGLLLSLAHGDGSGYPVTVEGGEAIVRGILQQIQRINGLGTSSGGYMGRAAARAGVKRADEVEFFGGGQAGKAPNASLEEQLNYWRDELGSALNFPNLRGQRGGGATIAMY